MQSRRCSKRTAPSGWCTWRHRPACGHSIDHPERTSRRTWSGSAPCWRRAGHACGIRVRVVQLGLRSQREGAVHGGRRVDRPVSLYAATKRANELMAYTLQPPARAADDGAALLHGLRSWGRPTWRTTASRGRSARAARWRSTTGGGARATSPTSTMSSRGSCGCWTTRTGRRRRCRTGCTTSATTRRWSCGTSWRCWSVHRQAALTVLVEAQPGDVDGRGRTRPSWYARWGTTRRRRSRRGWRGSWRGTGVPRREGAGPGGRDPGAACHRP